MRKEHPDRPQKPARIPFAGDDNSAWEAWWNACDSCRHKTDKWGCIVMGVVVYKSGHEYGFHCVRGGCSRWEPLPPR
jgi:hypothetical protein